MAQSAMIVRVSVATIAGILSISALTSACGSSPRNPNGNVPANFLAAANNACGQFLDQAQTKTFPWPDFVATDPPVSQLSAAGKYYDSLAINHEETNFVKAMGRPRQGQSSWNAFVALVNQQQTLVTKEIETAKASDKADFVSTVDQIANLTPKIDAAGAAAGFAKDSDCIQLLG